MGKKTRIILYAASLIILLTMVTLIIFSGGKTKQTSDDSGNGRDENKTAAEQPAGNTGEAAKETETEERTDSKDTEEITETEIAETETTEIIETEAGKTKPEETTSESTTLIFAGDVLFNNWFTANYDKGGIEKVVEPVLLKQLQEADIFMVNNEFPFSNRGTAMEDKQYTFRCDPKYVTALQEMGVDIVTLANNHALDFGREALSDTFTTLDNAGIKYAGAGETAERAYELQVIEKNGKKFGFLAASRVVPVADWKVEIEAPGMLTAYDDTKLVQLIEEAKNSCDFLSVYLHWGIERDIYPQDYQTKIAKDCVEAGADVIIGAHPHCLQGITYIEGKPVFYSLGNFVFGYNIDQTMALKVLVGENGEVSYQIIPAYASGATTQLMDEKNAADLYQYMMDISTGVKIDADGMITQ